MFLRAAFELPLTWFEAMRDVPKERVASRVWCGRVERRLRETEVPAKRERGVEERMVERGDQGRLGIGGLGESELEKKLLREESQNVKFLGSELRLNRNARGQIENTERCNQIVFEQFPPCMSQRSDAGLFQHAFARQIARIVREGVNF